MKFITGMFSHETNTYSNLPTGISEFQKHTMVEGTAIEEYIFY